MLIQENHRLAPYTTLGIGGMARYFAAPQTDEALAEAIQYGRDNALPIFILGGGSNTLISDDGFDGLVIHPAMQDVVWENADADGTVIVRASAGVIFDALSHEAAQKNLGGIESLSGIPGTVGGAAVQNIGAYGQELADTFVEAEAIDLVSGDRIVLTHKDMRFGYRTTALKSADNTRLVVRVALRLRPFDPENATRVAVEHGFSKLTHVPPKTASDMRRRVLETRRKKGMCYDVQDVDTHSVGSFFVNPVVSQDDASRIQSAHIIHGGQSIPMFPVANGVKLSAAWLIEQAGFSRGYRCDGAALSSRHCLAIINPGDAGSDNIIRLANRLARTVAFKYQIRLSPEVVYLAPDGISPLPLDFDHLALDNNVRQSAISSK